MYDSLLQLQKAILKKLEKMEGPSKEKIDLLKEAKETNEKLENLKTQIQQKLTENMEKSEEKKNNLDKDLEEIKKEKTVFQKPRVFKLDNRTTSFKITNLPEETKDEEKLKEHFKAFGIIKSISTNDDNTPLITFETRNMAEKAINLGKKFGETNLIMEFVHKTENKIQNNEVKDDNFDDEYSDDSRNWKQ
jgi:hypothetical protein